MGNMVRLLPNTHKLKNRIREHGKTWRLDSVAKPTFTDETMALIVADDGYMLWTGLKDVVLTSYCPICDAEQDLFIIEREETYPALKHYTVTIEANVAVCSVCGEDVLHEKLDNDNLLQLYNKCVVTYELKNGHMGADE